MNNIERRLFHTIMRSLEADARRYRRIAARKLTVDDVAALGLAAGWGAANGLKWLGRINEEIFRAALVQLGTRYEFAAARVIRLQNRAGARALEAVKLATRTANADAEIDTSKVRHTAVRGEAPAFELSH
jgi:hypothetical protein